MKNVMIMDNLYKIIIIFSLFLLYFLYQNYNDIVINFMVFLIVNRGIFTTSCPWWYISSLLLEDASGVNLYYRLKRDRGDIIKVNMLGEQIYLVTNIEYIKIILNNSPFIFGVGKMKYDMFKSFMPLNVGVSQGRAWIRRRKLNEKVLETGNDFHTYMTFFNREMVNILQKNSVPSDFNGFSKIAKEITSKIVFNDDKINKDIFKVFSEANSLGAIFSKNFKIDPKIKNVYLQYLYQNAKNPKYPSLVYLSKKYSKNIKISFQELINQIPHWIFPINNLIGVSFMRLLLILANHPHIFKKLVMELKINKNMHNIYLRYCILELFRLNNPVVTTFRTLLRDFSFPNFSDKERKNYQFKKDTQFLILNNPVLRDPTFFYKPNQYIPERWNPELEASYYAIMFNQGPQKCPGRNLAIQILASFTINYFERINIFDKNYEIIKTKKININNIPQMMNPCDIEFSFS